MLLFEFVFETPFDYKSCLEVLHHKLLLTEFEGTSCNARFLQQLETTKQIIVRWQAILEVHKAKGPDAFSNILSSEA